MQINVRQATVDDIQPLIDVAAEIHAFHAESLPDVFQMVDEDSSFGTYLLSLIESEDAALLIGEVDGLIAGFLCARILQPANHPGMAPRRFVSVDNVGVTEQWRSNGIGSALMCQVEQWALGRKVYEIQLNVWEFNQSAISFYVDLGYSTASRRMWKKLS